MNFWKNLRYGVSALVVLAGVWTVIAVSLRTMRDSNSTSTQVPSNSRPAASTTSGL